MSIEEVGERPGRNHAETSLSMAAEMLRSAVLCPIQSLGVDDGGRSSQKRVDDDAVMSLILQKRTR
jgi:hypothetical protein